MRALVISDIHGNLEALNAVLREAAEHRWEEIWFLGDLCGYGPDTKGCFLTLKEHRLIFLTGNHDLYITGDMEKEFFSDMARIALILTRSDITPELMGFLSSHSARQMYKGIELVHGSPIDPEAAYILNESDAAAGMIRARKKTVLFGHTHVQEYYLKDGDKRIIRRAPGTEPVSLKGRHILINPGSVGQPRDGDNRAAWGLMDTKSKEFTFFRTAYDYGITQQKMADRGFPSYLVERLAEGR